MNEATTATLPAPELVELQPRPAAVVRISAATAELPSLMAEAFGTTMEQIAKSGGQVAGPPFARYLGFGERIDAEVGFPFIGSLIPSERVYAAELPGGRAVLMTHVGAYDEIGAAWEQVMAWVAEHGLEQTSAPWESYLSGPDEPGPPVTQIVFPVR